MTTSGGPPAVPARDRGVLGRVLTSLPGQRSRVREQALLLQAVLRWRDGDMTARVGADDAGTELGPLAAGLDEMAAAIATREGALRAALADAEARVRQEAAARATAEAALHRAQRPQAAGQLIGGVAHDVNNRLATVLGCLELLERSLAAGAPAAADEAARRQRLIDRGMEAVQRAAQLTARLLAFSRRQHGTQQATHPHRVIGDMAALAEATVGRGVSVQTDMVVDPWPVAADTAELETAILHLCLNARDAMPAGGVLLIATGHETVGLATPDGPAPGDYLRLTVRDSGGGIAPDVLARATEPFFSTKGTGAAGLGLTHVQTFVRRCGGAMRIASVPDQGTAVTLLLPRAAAPAEPGPPPQAAPGTPPAPATRLVMLVDDDAAVRRVTREMLRDVGCEVIEASGAEEALALLDGNGDRPGLLLIDYAMPECNGIDLARAVRARGVTVPVLLATGYAEAAGMADGGDVDGVLAKPFSIATLRDALRRLGGRAGWDAA